METFQCKVCGASFRLKLPGQDICKKCANDYPDIGNLTETNSNNTNVVTQVVTEVVLSKNSLDQIKDIVQEIVDKAKQDIQKNITKEKKCKKCGNIFKPRSTAQLYCDECRAKKETK